MKKILYCIAMEKEAVQIADKLKLEKIAEKIYRKGEISLLITGIGKQRTAISLSRYLCKNEKPDLIINIGYVGSNILEIGKWYSINKCRNYEWEIPGEEKYDMLDYGFQDLETIESLEKAVCYTAESFVTSTKIEEACVFDMELHSISIICNKENIRLMSLKKVTDNLSIDKYYEQIAQKEIFELTSILDKLIIKSKARIS